MKCLCPNSTYSICCGFVVQQVVQQIHNKSKQWSNTGYDSGSPSNKLTDLSSESCGFESRPRLLCTKVNSACSCCNRGHRKCDKQLIFIVRVRHFTFYFRSCHTLTHEIHNKSATNRKVVQQIHDKSTTNRISGVWA